MFGINDRKVQVGGAQHLDDVGRTGLDEGPHLVAWGDFLKCSVLHPGVSWYFGYGVLRTGGV